MEVWNFHVCRISYLGFITSFLLWFWPLTQFKDPVLLCFLTDQLVAPMPVIEPRLPYQLGFMGPNST